MTEKIDNVECDINETIKDHREYKENLWPAPPEDPKGYTFKGKSKLLTFAVEKSKAEYNDIKFKVLDARKVGGANQITIEMADSDGRGNAIVDFWGPNKRKECTVMIKKSKDHEARFVKILAKSIIQPLLDSFIIGKSLDYKKSN